MWDNVEDARLTLRTRMTSSRPRAWIKQVKNRFQLTIHKLRRLGESELDFGRTISPRPQRYRRVMADSGG